MKASLSLKLFEKQQGQVWEEYAELLKKAKKDLAATKKLRDLYPTIAGHYAFLSQNHSGSAQGKKLKEYLHDSWRLLDVPVERIKPSIAFRFLAFYAVALPRQIYQTKRFFWASILFFWLSALISFWVTVEIPEFGSAFLGSAQYHHYRSQVELGVKFQNFFVPESTGPIVFVQVFLNNFKVSLLSLLGGMLMGVGTLYVLLKNSFLVGGLAGIYYSSEHFIDFISLIFQHGFLELMAISLSGAAGFLIASPFFFSGHIEKRSLFKKRVKQAFVLFAGSTSLLLLAGLIEGLITTLRLPIWQRFIVIGMTIFLFSSYMIYSIRLSNRSKRFSVSKRLVAGRYRTR